MQAFRRLQNNFWVAASPAITRITGQICLSPCTITESISRLRAIRAAHRAEHWVHLRTTNPIESTFATVRHRAKITKGPGSRAAGLAMAFKLIESAQDRWRAVNAPRLVARVRAGATFINGKLVERPGGKDQESSLRILIHRFSTIAPDAVPIRDGMAYSSEG